MQYQQYSVQCSMVLEYITANPYLYTGSIYACTHCNISFAILIFPFVI